MNGKLKESTNMKELKKKYKETIYYIYSILTEMGDNIGSKLGNLGSNVGSTELAL